jgi:stress-induced morphogen
VVHDVLEEELKSIHALQLVLKSPEEYSSL